MSLFHRAAAAGLAAIASLSLATSADAALATANTASCGGFSSCDDSAFLAAIGGSSDGFLDFATDKNGIATAGGSVTVSGDIFSDFVTFASRASTTYGGSDSANVQLGNGGTNSAEIGPAGTAFDGILDIIFGAGVSAVGFGTVQLDTIESISVYDTSNTLLATYGGVSNATFDYFGVYATAGELIGRISLEGDFFAIQNIQWDFGREIPLPAGLILFPAGLAALGFGAHRRRKAAA